MNGWIFSIWGIYDFYRYTGDLDAGKVLEVTLNSLEKKLPDFDIKYWSNYNYDDGKRICSPFYHKLHIAQLTVLYDLFGCSVYREDTEKWEKYQNSFWKPKKAFVKKALQKVFERT